MPLYKHDLFMPMDADTNEWGKAWILIIGPSHSFTDMYEFCDIKIGDVEVYPFVRVITEADVKDNYFFVRNLDASPEPDLDKKLDLVD